MGFRDLVDGVGRFLGMPQRGPVEDGGALAGQEDLAADAGAQEDDIIRKVSITAKLNQNDVPSGSDLISRFVTANLPPIDLGLGKETLGQAGYPAAIGGQPNSPDVPAIGQPQGAPDTPPTQDPGDARGHIAPPGTGGRPGEAADSSEGGQFVASIPGLLEGADEITKNRIADIVNVMDKSLLLSDKMQFEADLKDVILMVVRKDGPDALGAAISPIASVLQRGLAPQLQEALKGAFGDDAQGQTSQILAQLVHEAAHPEAINQGLGTYTCTTAVTQCLMARVDPIAYIRFGTDMLVNGSWTAPGGQTVPLNTGEVGHRHDPGDILDPLLQGSLLAFAKDQWPDTGTADATGGRMGSASTAGGGRLKAGTAGGGRPKVGTAGGGRSKSGTAAGAEGDVDDSEPDGLTGNQLANLIHATMGQDAQALLPSTAGGTLSAADLTRLERVLAGAAQTTAQGKFAAFSNGDADWDSIFEQGIPAAIRLGSDDEIASGDYALHAVMVVGMTRDSVTFFDPQANGGRGGQGTMSRKAFQERAEWAIIPPANKYVRPVGGGGVPKGFAESRNALL